MNCLKSSSTSFLIGVVTLLSASFSVAQQKDFVALLEKHQFRIEAGEQALLRLIFIIKENYHIQASVTSNEYLLPTKLLFDEAKLIAGEVSFPDAEKFYIKGVEYPIDVYCHELAVEVPVLAQKKCMTVSRKLPAHYFTRRVIL